MDKNYKFFEANTIRDQRGHLSVIEANQDVPFEFKRFYYLHGVPKGSNRGGHAHKALHQLVIPVSGSFKVILDDGNTKTEFLLNNPEELLWIKPMTWRELFDFSPGAICLVLASEHYDESDYFRDYVSFISAVRSSK